MTVRQPSHRALASVLVTLWWPAAILADIVNAGFEDGWAGWTNGDPGGSATALSGDAFAGEQSIKLTENGAYVAQVIAVRPNTNYRLSARVKGPGNLGVKVGAEIFFEQQSRRDREWRELAVTFLSGDAEFVTIFASCGGVDVRFDNFQLGRISDERAETSTRLLSTRAGGYGLSPDLPPGRNFDLLGWYLNTPADDDGDGRSDRLSEVELARGAVDERYFFTGPDGGMVFRATVSGSKTSGNTRFTRTELREMLRRGDPRIRTRNEDNSPNRNNWVFSSAPASAQRAAGAIDGTLLATLAINRVTETGDRSQIGRVIIGQIHASVDEPLRLYYRKLPENQRGAVYAAHEVSGGDDIYYDLIGSRSSNAPDPDTGIPLGERFRYEISVRGRLLYVAIYRGGDLAAEQTIDMSQSGYDVANEFMYFKAGVYNQNDTGEPDDFVQATFYELDASHKALSD